jgi:hypothetical protein
MGMLRTCLMHMILVAMGPVTNCRETTAAMANGKPHLYHQMTLRKLMILSRGLGSEWKLTLGGNSCYGDAAYGLKNPSCSDGVGC